nr:unnamed protein product [Digitaria exilis]
MGRKAAAAQPATVVLAVNGRRYEAAGVEPSTTLLEFLRTQTPVRGPKLGCGEAAVPWILGSGAAVREDTAATLLGPGPGGARKLQPGRHVQTLLHGES